MRSAIIVLIVFISACAPMAEIDLEIIDPAEYTFPVDVQQLAFINSIKGLPVMNIDTSKIKYDKLEILNSLASRRAFEGVRKALVSSPMYQIDTIRLLNYERYYVDSTPAPLSSREISYLDGVHPADALISLDKYTVKVIPDADSIKSSRSRVENHMLVTKAIWRIYEVSSASILDEYTYTDTVIDWTYKKDSWYYQRGSNLVYEDRWQYFLRKNISKEAYRAGLIYGNRISPAWIQVPRYYYKSGNMKMRQAARKATEDDWDGAAGIWKKAAYEEKEKTAARASFNMALMCEMEDLMLPAVDWANKSMILKPDTLTREYLDILKERNKQFEELEKQVPEPELKEPELPESDIEE